MMNTEDDVINKPRVVAAGGCVMNPEEIIAAQDAYVVARFHFGIRDSVAIAATTIGRTVPQLIEVLEFSHWAGVLRPVELGRDLVFEHEAPPIPTAAYDWACHRRGWDPEAQIIGRGETPLKAALALVEYEELLDVSYG